ncbi:hypothetical protein [uncultured Tateyamaria sp.]|uniref:hypothetical protein n=1 Tax=uncultured Tateyamaria sp. TaxID=455651 RepID=UPI002606CE17|nr:hypothetical protein [uncultured Tateyamaria sp.]
MIRIIAKIVLCIAPLAACTEYRELKANCFNFVAPAPGEKDCNFAPLGGPLDGATEIE